MAVCKFCGHYTDRFEWPEEYREYSKPNLCFSCYKEDPSRGVVIPGLEEFPDKEEMQSISEERESETNTTEEDDPDGSEDIFPDEDDGCQTEDDDYEDDPDDQ